MAKELSIEFKKNIQCTKNIGSGFIKSTIECNVYETTNITAYKTCIVFSLYDVEGWIGDYIIDRDLFFDNTLIDGNPIEISDLK